jgi:single-stranded-DNA-specific exonuclease
MTTKKEYRWKTAPPPPPSTVDQLAKELTLAPSLVSVLVNRGIDTYDKARLYFRPTLDQLYDPFLMDGMHSAVARLLDGRKRREKMVVYGDYDVDGTNSAAMLYSFFSEIGCDVTYYIPDRIKEGYGVTTFGIDQAKAAGASLMIAVDCGITAVEQVRYASSIGVEMIICDHHEPSDEIPDAVAVLDPLKPGCHYPFKYLCGCGVGFKFIQAIARTLGSEQMIFQYTDFVALATTADIVPLISENRILVRFGLDRINEDPRPGIRALVEGAGLQVGSVQTGQIVFGLAPRINAVGRLGDARRAVDMLISTDYHAAVKMARVLEEENLERRKIDEDVFFHAQRLVEEYLGVDSDGAIILHQEQWHPGVIGIVASRMVEKYYRPAIMMTTVDGVAKGSARSIAGFNIPQALKRVEDKLLQFGGHKYAAGLSVAIDRLDEFKEAFNAVVKELLTDEILTPEIFIDAELDLTELTPKYMRVLKQFAPFGPKNMRPVFVARRVEIASVPRIVGKNHLRLKVKRNGAIFDCIGFGLDYLRERIEPGKKFYDIVFSIDENDFTGVAVPQLKLKDLRQSVDELQAAPAAQA